MRDLKELWTDYQLEKELQIVPIESVDFNDARMKELQRALIGAFMPKGDDATPAPDAHELQA